MSRRDHMTGKPHIGAPVQNSNKFTTKSNEGKVSVYVPALKCYMMVKPGTDVTTKAGKYLDNKEFHKKTIH